MQVPVDLHIVGDDLPLRLARLLRLAPATGLGVGRRALALALLTWVPLALWAALEGRLLSGAEFEPLLGLFGVQAQALLGIPLFVAGEALARSTGQLLSESLERSKLVASEQLPALGEIIRGHVRWRRAALPWVVIVAVVACRAMVDVREHAPLESIQGQPETSLGFGGIWFKYVLRGLFGILVLGWIWRIALWLVLFRRLVRLELELVPAHPDRLMGLGFFERVPAAFGPFVLGLSTVLAADWAHQIVYHGAELAKFHVPLAVFSAIVAGLVLAPLLAFVRPIAKARRRAFVDYGALVACHHRLVHERWIQGREPENREVLDAPELGPTVDVASIFQAVRATRPIPIGKAALLSIAVPIILPMLVVACLKVPVGVMLLRILSAFV